MKFSEMTIEYYLNILGSKEPSPGGGVVGALIGANGASLLSMVCDLTINDAKYSEHHNLCKEAKIESDSFKNDFIELMEKDREAFNSMVEFFSMPKNTDEEKELRKQKKIEALDKCVMPPLLTMEKALETIKLVYKVKDIVTKNAISDIYCSAFALDSCMNISKENVIINTNFMDDDIKKNELENRMNNCIKNFKEIFSKVI